MKSDNFRFLEQSTNFARFYIQTYSILNSNLKINSILNNILPKLKGENLDKNSFKIKNIDIEEEIKSSNTKYFPFATLEENLIEEPKQKIKKNLSLETDRNISFQESGVNNEEEKDSLIQKNIILNSKIVNIEGKRKNIIKKSRQSEFEKIKRNLEEIEKIERIKKSSINLELNKKREREGKKKNLIRKRISEYEKIKNKLEEEREKIEEKNLKEIKNKSEIFGEFENSNKLQRNLIEKYYGNRNSFETKMTITKKNIHIHKYKKSNNKNPPSLLYEKLNNYLNTKNGIKVTSLKDIKKLKSDSIKLVEMKNFQNKKTKRKDSIGIITNNPYFHKNFFLLTNPKKFLKSHTREKKTKKINLFEFKNKIKKKSLSKSKKEKPIKVDLKLKKVFKNESRRIKKEIEEVKKKIDFLQNKKLGKLSSFKLNDSKNQRYKKLQSIIKESLIQ